MSLRLNQKISYGILAIVTLAMASVMIIASVTFHHAIDPKINSEQLLPTNSSSSIDQEISLFRSLEANIFVISLVAILAAFLLGMYFSKKIVEPIQALVYASRHIAHGDFNVKVPVVSHDEVGQLAESFNAMAMNLKTMLEREKHLAADAATAEMARRKAAELEEANRKILEKSDELKKVNAELDSFVYTASHDLRAPLRGISSFASFLEEDYKDKIDEEGQGYLREIRSGANILQDLIEDLLTLSKISRIRNPYEMVKIEEIISLGVERLRLYIKDHHAEVILPKHLPTIKCDRIKLTEVFVNLINNGIKFSSKNQANPRIEIGYLEEEKFHKFWVQDNGIGIDPRYHDQIFGIFRRLHTNKEYEGTGAGLTIVRKIIEEHQGQIWIESQEGQGAKFIFTISKNLQDKKKLGEILLENGVISKEHLDEGLKRQKEQG